MTFRFAYNLFRIHISSSACRVRVQGLKCLSLPRVQLNTIDEKSNLLIPIYTARRSFKKDSWATGGKNPDPNERVEDEESITRGIDKSFDIINGNLKKFGRVSRRNIEDGLRQIYFADRSQYPSYVLLLIRCCGKKMYDEPVDGRMEILRKVWDAFKKSGTQNLLEHYNSLIQVYVENGHQFSTEDILKDMSEDGVGEPDYSTYNKLLLSHSQVGDIDGANKILELMKEREISIGKETFDALILGHTHAGDMKSVSETMDMMSSFRYSPDDITYYNILIGLAEKGDIEKLVEIFSECDDKKIEFRDKELLEIILNLAINRHDEFIDQIIVKLRVGGIGYNRECINCIMQLICFDRIDVAFKMLKTMKIPVSITGGKVGVGIFFLKQIIKTEVTSEELCRYCKRLVDEEMHPLAYEISIKLLLQNTSESFLQALDILKEMKYRGIEIRVHYFYPLLCAAIEHRNKEGFFKVLKQASDWKMLSTFAMYRFGVNLMLPVTDEKLLIEELNEKGVDLPTVVSAFVEYYLYNRNPQKAVELCTHFKVPIDSYVHTNLVNCYCHVNCTKETVTILKFMLDQSHYNEMKSAESPFSTYNILRFIKGLDGSLRVYRMSIDPIVKFLQALKQNDIGLPEEAIDEISRYLGVDMNDQIFSLVSELVELRRKTESKALSS